MRCAQPNSAIQRLWTGALWSEGPAWNARAAISCGATSPTTGNCAGSRTTAASACSARPSNNSNGNTFDFQGRQLSCEHLTRRVVRYELDGSVTVLADSYNGKRLNSPNDVVPHPDGSYWFTDPPYGGQLYEGAPDAAGGPSNAAGKLNPKLGQPPGIGRLKRELPTNCYRIDPSGRVDLVVTEDQVPDPNGLCFSPDYKKLYVVSTGKGPGDTGPGGKGEVYVVRRRQPTTSSSNRKLFSDFMVDGMKCGPDGVRCDVDGNLGLEQCRPQRRLQRRHGLDAGGQADRPHPPARGLRQHLLRRPQAQPPVHGGEPVALRRLREHAGRHAGLARHRTAGLQCRSC